MVIKAIIGLGNPGEKYAKTRHNAGFWFLDFLANRCDVRFRLEQKLFGELARVTHSGQDIWLLKPTTFMNRSGQAVQALASYYQLSPEQLLVVHDELDLQPGIARFKWAGGHAGHNGLRDIHKVFGDAYGRLRIGIGRPVDQEKVISYVLKPPGKKDSQAIEQAIYEAERALPKLLTEGLQSATQQLHSALKPVE